MTMNTDGKEHLRHGGYIKKERNNLGAAAGKPKTFAFRATPPFSGGKLDCLRNFCLPCRQNFCLPCRTPQNRTKWLKNAPFETTTTVLKDCRAYQSEVRELEDKRLHMFS